MKLVDKFSQEEISDIMDDVYESLRHNKEYKETYSKNPDSKELDDVCLSVFKEASKCENAAMQDYFDFVESFDNHNNTWQNDYEDDYMYS
ncbi:MAG: hypothetical protein ACYDD5_00415 [Sulfuricurvum sp.]